MSEVVKLLYVGIRIEIREIDPFKHRVVVEVIVGVRDHETFISRVLLDS